MIGPKRTTPGHARGRTINRNLAGARGYALREIHAAPVIITYPDGTVRTETPEEFRAARGLSQCQRCFQWVSAATLTATGERGRATHQCRWVTGGSHASDVFQSGVDAWFGDRPTPRRQDDVIDAVEA